MNTKSKIQNFYDNTFLPALIATRPAKTKVTTNVLKYSEVKNNDGLNQNFDARGAIKISIVKDDDSFKSFYVVVDFHEHFALVSFDDVLRCNKTVKWNWSLNESTHIKEQNQLLTDRNVDVLAANDIDKVFDIVFS